MSLDVASAVRNPLRLIVFPALLLIVRGLPALCYRRVLSFRKRAEVAFFTATTMPLLVRRRPWVPGPSCRSFLPPSRVWAVPELQRLCADHAEAVLDFELANRAYFAGLISDRGDEFFDRFTERHSAMLAEQEGGICAFYVLVADDGSVLGRFNLYNIKDGTANLGFRVAQHTAGRGVATATVRELCRLAAAQHGLRTLKAAAARGNVASQKVLAKTGFVEVGPADPADLGGNPGTWYQRDLTTG